MIKPVMYHVGEMSYVTCEHTDECNRKKVMKTFTEIFHYYINIGTKYSNNITKLVAG